MTAAELRGVGFEVNDLVAESLRRFVHLLLDENQRQNLTGSKTADELWRVHLCDSLALVPRVREHRIARLLDLGSGGGLPGIPLACVCPDMKVTLLDATRKKIAALERMILALELSNTHTVWGRAEALANQPEYREQFDGVTARAVAGLPVLIEYAAGFVCPSGHAWFYKSAAAAEAERAAAESAAQRCRLSYLATHAYRLPGEDADRALLVYRKDGVLDVQLPRRSGQAKRRPL